MISGVSLGGRFQAWFGCWLAVVSEIDYIVVGVVAVVVAVDGDGVVGGAHWMIRLLLVLLVDLRFVFYVDWWLLRHWWGAGAVRLVVGVGCPRLRLIPTTSDVFFLGSP